MVNALFLILLVSIFAGKAHASIDCGLNFVKFMNGEMPAKVFEKPSLNIWDEAFSDEALIREFQGSLDKVTLLKQLSRYAGDDIVFNENLASLATKLYQKKILTYQELRSVLLNQKFGRATFSFSHKRKEMFVVMNFDKEKKNFLESTLRSSSLSKTVQKNYLDLFMKSKLSEGQIRAALKGGLRFTSKPKEFEVLKDYLDFLMVMKPEKIKSGLKNIGKIYDRGLYVRLAPVEGFMQKPHNHFLVQRKRIQKYIEKRTKEIERGFKLQQSRNGTIAEIDEAIEKKANGFVIRTQEKLRFRKRLDDIELPHAMKKRAARQAMHESSIYKKMMRGCNSGSGKRISGAKKKFSRFKFALMMAVTPTFYTLKNSDKRMEDQAFWEKLGHEMVMNILFTYVSNKLFTNTSTGFWRKYFTGYVQFGALGYAEAVSYEALFGKKSYIRYLQKIYKKDVPASELETELEKLKNSPTFEKDVKELLTYLDQMSKKSNTKNLLERTFNLDAFSTRDEEIKITREDLESEEAREMMMELIAERLYLENMGKWEMNGFGIFQTGSKAHDRFGFYRTRASFWDLKGIALNMAIFEMMCREPFGKIGSWGAILSLIIGDNILTGDLTYQYRRDMINQ